MSTTTDEQTLTVKEAAAKLRLSKASVYELCKRRILKHSRVGPGRGKIVIEWNAVERYLADSKGDTLVPTPLPPLVMPRARPKPVHVRMKP